jgi:hypothetical protein
MDQNLTALRSGFPADAYVEFRFYDKGQIVDIWRGPLGRMLRLFNDTWPWAGKMGWTATIEEVTPGNEAATWIGG